MSRPLLALAVLAVLGGLFAWQQTRTRQINACITANGAWDGATSSCRPLPGSPILQRDLRRS
jgi:hypothetical protein